MEKRIVNIGKKEVKPVKKRKVKVSKKVFQKKTEKREMKFNSMNDYI